VDRIEDAQKRPVPIPRVEFASYLGFGGLWLFEAACSVDRANTEGWRITWQFEDGGTFTGPSVPRALVGGAPMKVRVQMQRGSETVAGLHRISFAEVPRQASVNETSDVNRYLALLAKETPAQLSARTLRAAIIFLGEYGSEQEAGRFADAYLKRPADANDPVWAQAQIAHLRVLSQTDPQQALKELRRLDPNVRKRHSQQFDFFEMDLLVFYLRDDSAVQRAQQIALENPNAEVGRIARVRVGDLYRLQGRTKEAIEHYHGLQRALGEETAGRKLPAQDRAFSMAVADMLAHGFRQEVEGKLREWESAHPLAKVESDFLLMRARFLMTLGRWREALTEIESFEKMQPDSPYQIDLDFHRARALHELGQKEQARKIWAEIARKYPKHALADESKSWANKR
jgi:tetratricopeptide (TPR) repeat protein